MHQRWLTFRFAIALTLGTSSSVFAMDASTKEVVRDLTNDGVTDFDAGRYEEAQRKLQRAYDAAKVPTIGLLLAHAQVKLGHLVLAQETYRQVLTLDKNELWVKDIQEQAQSQAQQELDALKQRVPQLTVRIEGADASRVDVTIDGELVPKAVVGFARSVDPGKRSVVGKLGEQMVEQPVTIDEGERKETVLRFVTEPGATRSGGPTAAPSAPNEAFATTNESRSASAQRTWGWIGLGVGAAGLAVGTVAGIVVASKYSSLNEECGGDKCVEAHWSAVDSYDKMQTVSTVGFIAGGVVTAVGVTLLLTSPKETPPSSVSLWMSPASAGLRGSF